MKRKWTCIVLLIFSIIGISSCANEEVATNAPTSISEQVLGTHQEDVRRILGEPSGKLSGFTGDIYIFDNDTQMVFYYDDKMNVERLKITDSEGEDTFIIE